MKMIGLSTNSRQLSYVRYICFENQYTLDNFVSHCIISKVTLIFYLLLLPFQGMVKTQSNQKPINSQWKALRGALIFIQKCSRSIPEICHTSAYLHIWRIQCFALETSSQNVLVCKNNATNPCMKRQISGMSSRSIRLQNEKEEINIEAVWNLPLQAKE